MDNNNQTFSVEAEELVTFRDDAPTQVLDPPNQTIPLFVDHPNEGDVSTVLARPILVWAGNVTSTATTSQAYSLPNIWIASSKNVQNKLANYTFLRGTLCARLTVNATPFQCGKYWMYYVPYSKQADKYPYTEDLSHITGYPGVELDLASSKSVVLKIPLVGPYDAVNLIQDSGRYGDMFVRQLVGITDGTSAASAAATVHMWMEDAEVYMPAAKASVYNTLYAQSKDEAHAAAKSGMVSGFASKVSSLASSVGQAFPSISAYTAPLSWAAGVVSGVASYFGFSKPTSLETATAVYALPAKGYTNVSGVDYGVTLGAFPDNAVDQRSSVAGTDVDEMSISYISQRPCIYQTFVWKTEFAESANLYNDSVRPTSLDLYDSGKCLTLLQYVATMFRYWTGSITYRFAFAKTAFHTGRIQIEYLPDGQGGPYRPEVYRWIVDLSTTSEITLNIPWVSNMPWKSTSEFNGNIIVSVLNPLNVSSESAASTITCLVWKYAGPDCKFASPDITYRSEVFPETLAAQYVTPRLLPRAQIMNETASQVHDHNGFDQLMPYRLQGVVDAPKAAMGECVTSLRSLTKRFTPQLTVLVPTDGINFLFPNPEKVPWAINFTPHYYGNVVEAIGIGGRTKIDGDVDASGNRLYRHQTLLGFISQVYRFARGSTRFKYMVNRPGGFAAAPVPRLVARISGISDKPYQGFESTADCTNGDLGDDWINDYRFSHSVGGDNGVVEITVPHYSRQPFVLVSNGTVQVSTVFPQVQIAVAGGQNPTVSPNNPDSNQCLVRNAVQWFPSGTLYAAAGDDFSFSFLGGAPPVRTS